MKLLGQATLIFADRIAFAGSIFATGVLIARTFGPEGFGLYVWASAIVQTVLGAIAVGTEAMFVRTYAAESDPQARHQVVNAFRKGLFRAALCAAACLLAAGALANLMIPSDRSTESGAGLMLWAGAASLVQLPWMIGEWRLRARGEAGRIARIRVPVLGAAFAFKCFLAVTGAPLHVLYAVIGLETAVLASLFSVEAARREKPAQTPTQSALVPPPGLGEAFRLGFAAFLWIAFVRVNPVILAAMANVNETAVYGAALALVLSFDLITTSLSAATFPSIVRERLGPDGSLSLLKRLAKAYAGLSVMFVLFIVLFGESVLKLVYGAAWDNGLPVLIALSISTIFTSSGAVRGLYINLIGRSDIQVFNGLIGLGVLLPLSIALSSQYGALGAAVAASIACAISCIVASFLFEPTRVIGRMQLSSFFPRLRSS
jgi:O-antigen/teichoic acid export membrane protein